MKSDKNIKLVILLIVSYLLVACGAAHVKTDVQTQDLDRYENMRIGEVKVYSNEEEAKSNHALQEKIKSWRSHSRKQLERYITDSKYKLTTSVHNAEDETLLMDLDVKVQYGNRALRWAVGFGAGKGGVDSVLTIKDATTGEVKYKTRADSDLSIGVAGGDMGSVLEKNIQELLRQFDGV